jgi:hypothetical protein
MKRKPKLIVWGITLYPSSLVEFKIQIGNKLYRYESRELFLISIATDILNGYKVFTFRTLNQLKKYAQLIGTPRIIEGE